LMWGSGKVAKHSWQHGHSWPCWVISWDCDWVKEVMSAPSSCVASQDHGSCYHQLWFSG
jgi:hypothetical protein